MGSAKVAIVTAGVSSIGRALVCALARVGRPEDLTAPLLFLISDAAGFVTGQTLSVDGGAFGQANWPYEVTP